MPAAYPLPDHMHVEVQTSYIPRCELCGWIGAPRFTNTDARRACRDHAKRGPHSGKRHQELAGARGRDDPTS